MRCAHKSLKRRNLKNLWNFFHQSRALCQPFNSHLNSFFVAAVTFFPHSIAFHFISSRHKTSISHQFSSATECFGISGAIKGEKGKKKILEIVLAPLKDQLFVVLFPIRFLYFNLTRCYWIPSNMTTTADDDVLLYIYQPRS